MKTFLLIGANGFIAKNFRAYAEGNGHQCLLFHHDEDNEKLLPLVQKSDYIYFLAGVNRPTSAEGYQDNVLFVKKVLDTLKEIKPQVPFFYASTQKVESKSAYGESKLAAEEVVKTFHEETHWPVYIFRFNNIFGKWAQPDYNSVIATFCVDMISKKLPPFINEEEINNFTYIDQVVSFLLDLGLGKYTPTEIVEKRLPTAYDYVADYAHTASDLWVMLQMISDGRIAGKFGSCDNTFLKQLTSTYMSYLPTDQLSLPVMIHSDERGSLHEFIQTQGIGQMVINTIYPKHTKGGHWHMSKWERFMPISGKALVRLRKKYSEEINEILLNATEPFTLDIPPGYVHEIVNIGQDDFVFAIYSSERYDPQKADTYPEKV